MWGWSSLLRMRASVRSLAGWPDRGDLDGHRTVQLGVPRGEDQPEGPRPELVAKGVAGKGRRHPRAIDDRHGDA